MSEPFNEDEYEEIEEEDEIKEKEVPIEEEMPTRPNNLQSINQKRNVNKKSNAIRYLVEFSQNPDKKYDEIANVVGISKAVAQKYLREYAAIVINSIQSGTFPSGVVLSYNDVSIPKAQRLTVGHIQDLKPILLKYHKVNIDEMMKARDLDKSQYEEDDESDLSTSDGYQNDLSTNRGEGTAKNQFMGGYGNDLSTGRVERTYENYTSVAPENDLSTGRRPKMQKNYQENDLSTYADDIVEGILDDEPEPTYKKFNEFKQSKATINTNPRAINENSPIQDVIEFGIANAGQPDMAKIRRIKTMFMSSPYYYLSDEARFIELLQSNEIKDKTLSTFMNWLKNIAPIKPSERVGWLNLSKPTQGGGGDLSTPRTANFKNFNIDDYDDYAQYLYHEGVFTYGLPPNHRVNQENYKQYQEKKKMEQEEQQTMRQISLMTKRWMAEMQMKGLGMNPNGQPINQSAGTAYDERYLFERGIVAPEITYTEDGRKVTRWIPTGKPLYGGFDNQQNQPPRDSFTESVNMVTRLIEAVRPMLTNGQNGGGQNSLIEKLVGMTFEKIINKAEESPSKMLENQIGLFNQMKSFLPQPENKLLDKDAMQLELEKIKIQQDGRLTERELEIKEKHWQTEQQRLEEQKSESKDNITMIMEWVAKGFGYLQPLLGQILMGQIGGGLSNMMPPGGGGMMPPGGIPEPYPQPPSPYIPQTDPFVDNTTAGIPDIPQDFLPQEQYYEPPPPQQTYEPPQPVYQPPPPPVYYEQPPPQQETENDFLNNITADDLNTLTTEQLEDVEQRLRAKMSKMERVYNGVKSTKAKKQFGYRTNYDVLDIPKEMPTDYDGISTGTQQQVEETVIEYQPAEFVFDSNIYNNDIMEITDMGNDNQQFNQQNETNQKDFIEQQERNQKDRELHEKIARLQAKGCSINVTNAHLFDENGNPINNDAAADPASPLNKDQYHKDNTLDETHHVPSKDFTESHKHDKKENISDKDREHNITKEQEQIRKDSNFGTQYKEIEHTELKETKKVETNDSNKNNVNNKKKNS